MRLGTNGPEKIVRIATLVTLSVMVAWGLVSVIAEVRPFWVDEWRIIYNLKFKSPHEIWGKLAFMQQFPRAYLFLLKMFITPFGYSYWSLRLPSFIVGTTAIYAIYKLANKLYPTTNTNRFLIIMMLVSCGTFTEYYVEIKQYTMELLLCVVAIHQLLYLLNIPHQAKLKTEHYILLCISFLVLPFFSYTYPIVIAPAYGVLLVQNIKMWGDTNNTPDKIKTILLQWVPLFICTFSITTFYVLDIAQLSKDVDMQKFWAHLLMKKGFDPEVFFRGIFHLFAQVGSGFVFWWISGILGVSALGLGIFHSVKNLSSGKITTTGLVLLYSVLLPVLAIILFAFGKLPLGEPRLNAFMVPAISILIVYLLDSFLAKKPTWRKTSQIITYLLLVGLIGNIFTTIIASFTDEKYAKRMDIYHATQDAITLANEHKLPILITPGIAYPYDNTINYPYDNTVPGDWVLMTFPAYRIGVSKQVYAIDDTGKLAQYLPQLPTGISSATVGDGLHYRIVDVGPVK